LDERIVLLPLGVGPGDVGRVAVVVVVVVVDDITGATHNRGFRHVDFSRRTLPLGDGSG
jgi:hypothetical protein